MIIVIMGVAGCGKTTVGRLLAAEIEAGFLDADELHPPENIRRMAAGVPLTDQDRLPWLELVRDAMLTAHRNSENLVVACSALKKSYRDLLRKNLDGIRFVYLRGSREKLAARIQGRRDHFMPPEMLDSQLAALEEPGPDEAIAVSVDRSAAEIAREIRQILESGSV